VTSESFGSKLISKGPEARASGLFSSDKAKDRGDFRIDFDGSPDRRAVSAGGTAASANHREGRFLQARHNSRAGDTKGGMSYAASGAGT